MKGGKIYIAILLLGIFVYPGIYLPFHVLEHHSHEHSVFTGICGEYLPDNSTQKVGQYVYLNDHCPLFEYKIPLSDLFNHFFCNSVSPIVYNLIVEDVIYYTLKYFCLNRIPRAPPSTYLS